jgi:hypothetical protein
MTLASASAIAESAEQGYVGIELRLTRNNCARSA